MNQEFNKVIKVPRYTGVTLSLLSMFVLAAMFVVWQKFPKDENSESDTKISVICDTALKVPAVNIISSFEKEYSCDISVNFLHADDIKTKVEKLYSDPIDMLIFNESDLAKIAEINSSHASIIPFAFEKTFGSDDIKKAQPFSCLIKHGSSQSHSAFAIARYFSAPSRGQFFLAEAGYPGVDGDQWKSRPSVSIMVENNYEKDIGEFTKIFGQREGITFEISKKSLNEANATINLISKSNAKEYMPDLLIGFGQLGAGNSSFVNLGKNKDSNCMVSYSSKFKKTAIRFWKFLNSRS